MAIIQRLKTALKKVVPHPLLFLYRSLRDYPDLARVAHFVMMRKPRMTARRRLAFVWRVSAISKAVRCPHAQHEILSFVDVILSIPPHVRGFVVEAGCYKGGSTAKFSIAAKAAGRRLVVFDSFEGIPEHREPHSRNMFGRPAGFPKGSYRGSLDEVEENIRRHGKIEVCEFIKGWFEDTIPCFNRPIAAIYLDVDLASSTITCLKYLYPRLIPGGVLLSHDGHLPLVIQVFDDRDFWEREVGCPKPRIPGLGKRKLLKIVKPIGDGNRPGGSTRGTCELAPDAPSTEGS